MRSYEYIKNRLLNDYRIAPSPVDPVKYPDCWWWTGSKLRDYGIIKINRHNVMVHRISSWFYKLKDPNGDIFYLDSDYFVCHHCDNKLCINPKHLIVQTIDWNNKDKAAKGRSWRGGNRVQTYSC